MNPSEAVAALASLTPAEKRGQVVKLGNITAINDCYNCNPKALEAMVDALPGLTFASLSGPMTIGKDHHTTMNMFLAKTKGPDLVQVRALGEIAPESGCKPEALAR